MPDFPIRAFLLSNEVIPQAEQGGMNDYPLSHGLAERPCQTSTGRGELRGVSCITAGIPISQGTE